MLDTINVVDDEPAILFGPTLEGCPKDTEIPHFYLSLKCHDFILHIVMLDSGASHNLIPKVIMEKLGMSITRPYHDLYSFDLGRVKCLSLKIFSSFLVPNFGQECSDGCSGLLIFLLDLVCFFHNIAGKRRKSFYNLTFHMLLF